jgi:lipid II:glycine glycyltransferase (peptidoglycan interpeptide bridge formation enzyme)
MIKLTIESGCDIYDFRGITGDLREENPLYGLYKFKKGFNGKYTEFVGMVDYIFNPFMYVFVEKGIDFYREFRRQLFIFKNRGKNENVPAQASE